MIIRSVAKVVMQRSFPVLLGVLAALGSHGATKPEPRVFTIYPFGGQRGATYRAVVRGVSLEGAYAMQFTDSRITARVERVEREAGASNDSRQTTPADLIHVEIAIDAAATAGRHPFRIVTPGGVTNETAVMVNEEPAIQGRIARKGDVETHWIDVEAGEQWTFEATAGHAAFDPSITILEPAGSWFDSKRLTRVAFNDEPLYFPGLSTDARLAYRFERGGRYAVRVQAFSGQGGPDYVYQLRIKRGVTPPPKLHPKKIDDWDERLFTRHFAPDWLERLEARGRNSAKQPALETFHTPSLKIPGVVVGRIASPGEVHSVPFHWNGGKDLVLEIETPNDTMPVFNPVVRLLDSSGREVMTSIYTKRNNCGFYLMKMIEAKVVVPLPVEGDYTLQIRDITTDRAGEQFQYRVLVRSQIPHIGKVSLQEDRLNLGPGETKPLNIVTEREEEFTDLVAVTAENLPAGVSVVAGSENPAEVPPLMNGGKVERYIPKTQKSVLLLVAAGDAPLTQLPASIRVVARPVVNGKLGEPVAVKQIPLMIVARPAPGDAKEAKAVTKQ